MKQRKIKDIKGFSALCFQENLKGQNKSLDESSKLKVKQIRGLYNNVHNKDEYCASLKNLAVKAANLGVLPTLDGIPLTDILLYSNKRTSEERNLLELNVGISALLSSEHFTTVPSFISTTYSPDGSRHLPTFGEMAISSGLSNCDVFLKLNGLDKTNDSSQMTAIEKQSIFTETIVNTILTNMNELGFDVKNNFHLASAAAKGVNYQSDNIFNLSEKFRSDGLAEKTIAQALIHALSNEPYDMNDRQLCNAIESAYDNNINIRDIVVCQADTLEETLGFIGSVEAERTFSRMSKKQIVDELQSSLAHQLDHSYDPMSHFDL